jgi:hypothetical protein
VTTPDRPANTREFRVNLDLLPVPVTVVASNRQTPPGALTLTDPRAARRVIAPATLQGVEVRIVAYADDQALILVLRFVPLHFARGAPTAGNWIGRQSPSLLETEPRPRRFRGHPRPRGSTRVSVERGGFRDLVSAL